MQNLEPRTGPGEAGRPVDPVGGATRIVGIVGDPVAQVKSPVHFNRTFARRGIDAVMVPLHMHTDRFGADIGAILRLGNLHGLVVTMPFKARIIPELCEISAAARHVGAVNAARRLPDGRWRGDIFDGVGLVGAARAAGFEPHGRRAGLVGAGGAGSAIAFALAHAGAASLIVADRDHEKASDLARRLCDAGFFAQAVRVLKPTGLDLLVNASPVGMSPDDPPPVDITELRPDITVVDIVTRPQTRLLEAARRAGCRVAGGTQMVEAQTAAIVDFLALPEGGSANGSRLTMEETP